MPDPRSREGLPDKNSWRTPINVFKAISMLTGVVFDLDPCAAPDNHLGLPHFYTEKDDGLRMPWVTPLFSKPYVNPPFSRKVEFLGKSIKEARKGAEVVVLLEAGTDTHWFHRFASKGFIFLLEGRIQFESNTGISADNQGRRGHCLIYYGNRNLETGSALPFGRLYNGIKLASLDAQTRFKQ